MTLQLTTPPPSTQSRNQLRVNFGGLLGNSGGDVNELDENNATENDSDSSSEGDTSSDGYDTVCDGDNGGDNADSDDDKDEEDDDDEEDDEEIIEEISEAGESLRGALDRAIGELLAAQAVLVRLSNRAASRSSTTDHGDHYYNDLLNQSAANSFCSDRPVTSDNASTDGASNCGFRIGEEQMKDPDTEGESMIWWPQRPKLREVSEVSDDDIEENDEEEGSGVPMNEENCAKTKAVPRQQLTTCEEDVIGQRLNACLRLLQGGPFQECDLCVRTLSTCDQSALSGRELLDRLYNLETLLVYLQLTRRSNLTCAHLNQLSRLKRAVACLHGCLLRRQAEATLSSVTSSHDRLERRGGDFRRGWRRVPPGGERFRFVADPLRCVPPVEPGDEWLREFLPAGERASLGHILADAEPLVAERLGRRMALTKRRGRSTRLHNLFTRDGYEDMLGRFRFALDG